MNPVQFTPLKAPPVFAKRDLRPYMLQIIQDNSGGLINDRAPHAPTVVLTDAFEFNRLELEYAANKMAERAATLHLQTCGIQRRLGRKAQVTLTFTLSAPLAQFVLSQGYRVSGEGNIDFFTDVDVTVQNAVSFTVTATAKETGSRYNVAAYTLDQLSQTRAFLQSVTNTEPAAGGLDAETEEEAKARGYQSIRRKKGTLISADDFEQYTQEVLGLGSVVKAVGLLTPDKSSRQAGFVHLFALNADGSQLNTAQREALQAELNLQIPVFLRDEAGERIKTMASGVAVSSLELYPLEVSVVATLIPGDNPERRAQAINAALVRYLKPGALPIGETVVLYSIISVIQNQGVKDLQSAHVNVAIYNELTQQVTVETFYGNIPLPSEWTAAYCRNVSITLVNAATDQAFEFSYGSGGDLD